MAQPAQQQKTEEPVTGTAFLQSIRGLSPAQIETRVYQQVVAGNIPDFMRRNFFRPITVEMQTGGRRIQATFRVASDYIAIGTNGDYVRVPLNPLTAQRIAAHLGCVLPTARIVDLIDAESKRTGSYLPFHAAPSIARRVTDPDSGKPVSARWNTQKYGYYEGTWMRTIDFFAEQSVMVDESRSKLADPNGVLSGHKKDVVYHPEAEARHNVAIYHDGIQGLNYVTHENTYQDYSHGVRLIDSNVSVTITEPDGSQRTETISMATILSGSGNAPYNKMYQLFSPITMDISRIYQPAPQARAAPRPARQAVPRKKTIDLGELN
ncbi:MAG: hypothetical protein U0R44_01080 [Candidatus Micrarchaeia archaeon]